ncbi:hypothetical protein FGE12_23355 [Aggregicoccus sp. 17bor-14]|uniref:hypothetical protein n=1 Tax=Myxococcaceae TaxID=31 RepID=UPI00129C1488|nr:MULTISPECIES: hypothetical protein [Myxococcaceae]MBF5045362.1 hypothetical protein [Simulacricoccus sp. 17bor-14]MRI91104.1 hypothetical protein [Aggregicoccus sp. 17bor-14]
MALTSAQHLARAAELSARGRPELAESALSDAIDAAVAEEDLRALTRARLALGTFLVDAERADEAYPFLKAVVRTEFADGSVDAEVKVAARLLRQVRGEEE